MLILFNLPALNSGEVNSWDCNKFDGARIMVMESFRCSWLAGIWIQFSMIHLLMLVHGHKSSIFNTSTDYGNSYSNLSVFNDGASKSSKIIGSSGMVGYLSVGPSWQGDRFSPYDIKYTCDWD